MMTIVIHPYDPTWPDQFEKIRRDLRSVLGKLALRIDHIGSTSVPGLAAKDVIDVQITVADLTGSIRDDLVDAGYQHHLGLSDHVPPGEDPSEDQWIKLVFSQKEGDRRANIHVRVEGRLNQRYALRFRDYLRAHPASAEAIGRVKQALAKYHPEDKTAYYEIKDPVYDLIWDAAKRWQS